MRRCLAPLALTLLLCAGSSGFAQDKPALEPGRVLQLDYDFELAGKKMGYCLYLPKSYKPEGRWPLMVALHGWGSNPGQLMMYPGLVEQADKHGIIVVAPMGYNERGWYGSSGWKSPRSQPQNLGELSEKDVMNVLARTRAQLPIDEERIYLMGHSMGGAGTIHLGAKFPELWAGLAPIAPAIRSPLASCEKLRKLPVIMVQGAKDRTVPPTRPRQWAARMKELGMAHSYIEDPEGGHVAIAFKYMPQIFEFLAKQRRGAAPAPAPKRRLY
jgi:poly(3-hydroxybutyrate) depolymerase